VLLARVRFVSHVPAEDPSRLLRRSKARSRRGTRARRDAVGVGRAVGSLVGASVLAAWMKRALVGAAEAPARRSACRRSSSASRLSRDNRRAAEADRRVAVARRNKLDLTIGIAIGPAAANRSVRRPGMLAAADPRHQPLGSRSAAPSWARCLTAPSWSAPSSGDGPVELVKASAHAGLRDDRCRCSSTSCRPAPADSTAAPPLASPDGG
jgi:hypothetical protein